MASGDLFKGFPVRFSMKNMQHVRVLEKFEDGAVVDAQAMLEKGILSKCQYGVKILGNGEISKKLIVKASAFSASAKEKIVAAGGKWEVV